jgi:hypothetical protein
VNAIDAFVEKCVVPANVTDQFAPDGRPLPVNVTRYVALLTGEEERAL